MPQQRMDIRMIKDILRLKYQGGLSHERIAQSLSISKGAVAKYLSLAGGAGLDWASTAELDEASLERRLMGGGAALSRVVEPDYARVHIELRRKCVTLMLLWGEYRAAHEGQRTWAYTQFCGHYKAFAKTLKRSMRQQRRAGEKLFIDYAGPTLELADGSRAQVFVAAMGASSYTFACATADQSMRSWLGAMARALTFYGGVPQLIVPDNPRALVSAACHARSARRGGFTTLDAHMPAAHRAHKEWTPERLIHWGGDIGVNTGCFVTQLLQRFRHPEHGYRSCLGLLGLVKRYGPQRVEAACMLALELGAGQDRHVRDILANGRDQIERPAPTPEWVSPEHDNLRGASYFHGRIFHMMMNNTLAQLRDLKLAGMASAVEEQLSSSASTGLSFEERLALMVDREVHHRDDKRRAALMKRAGLKYPQACIEDVDSRAGRGFERSALMSLALSRWVEDGTAILISGATGSGKSRLARALEQ